MINPKEIKTNSCTELLKVLAGIAMLADHFGKMFFPKLIWLRYIGRLSFPLFAYCIALGAVYTKDPLKYLSRIVLLALISQPLYALGLAHEQDVMYKVPFLQNPLQSIYYFYIGSWQKPSILLSLCLGLCILLMIRKKQFILAIGCYILCERFAASLDYGINGIRFMLICYLFLEHPYLFLLSTVGFWLFWAFQGNDLTLWGRRIGMRIFALPSLFFAAFPLQSRYRLPKWLSYGFYPGHLAILAILTHL